MTDRPEERIAVITGGRKYTPTETEMATLATVLAEHEITKIHVGDAPSRKGVDAVVWRWARGKYKRERFIAEWKRYGQAAGPLRNARMLADSRVILCCSFRGNEGTKDCTAAARRREILVVDIDERQRTLFS